MRRTRRSKKSSNIFRFRDLPSEIQLRIFHLLKPPVNLQVAPWECNDERPLSLRRIEVSIDDEDRPPPLYHWPFADNATAFCIACLDEATFKDFAPHLYRYSIIVFGDPLIFSHNFLSNATDACLYNLRYLRCVLNNDNGSSNYKNLWELKRLPDLFSTWPELSALQRLEVVFRPGFYCKRVIRSQLEIDGGRVSWEAVDSFLDKKLSSCELKLQSKALKGFQVTRGVDTSDPDGFGAHILTFTRGGEAAGV